MTFALAPDSIDTGTRRRPLNPARVKALAGSMAEIGLQTPIGVHPTNDDWPREYALVTGHHRLAAAKELGWEKIEVFTVHLDELGRELWEIDENLIRANLSKAEEAGHLKRRKEIFETHRERLTKIGHELKAIDQALNKNDKLTMVDHATKIHRRLELLENKQRASCFDSGKSFPTPDSDRQGFAAATAEALGRTKRSVNQAIQRAENIAPDVLGTIKNMPAGNSGVELDALAGIPAEEQRQALDEVKSGRAPNFRVAIPLCKIAPKTKEAINGTPAATSPDELSALADMDASDQFEAVQHVKCGYAKNFKEAAKLITGKGGHRGRLPREGAAFEEEKKRDQVNEARREWGLINHLTEVILKVEISPEVMAWSLADRTELGDSAWTRAGYTCRTIDIKAVDAAISWLTAFKAAWAKEQANDAERRERDEAERIERQQSIEHAQRMRRRRGAR